MNKTIFDTNDLKDQKIIIKNKSQVNNQKTQNCQTPTSNHKPTTWVEQKIIYNYLTFSFPFFPMAEKTCSDTCYYKLNLSSLFPHL